MRGVAILWLCACGIALAQQPPPRPNFPALPPPPNVITNPAYPLSNYPPTQPPVELANPPAMVDKVTELPVPVGRQCMREVVMPCADDASRSCKQIQIANCD